jgi:hypothetical protein
MNTWNGTRRCDGVQLVIGLDGWIIIPADERPAIDTCPCCDKRLMTQHAAQAVADAMLPVQTARALS